MFATLPLEAFVCREVVEAFFWQDQPFNQTRHVVITTALVFNALIGSSISLLATSPAHESISTVSLWTCDLGFILELAGGSSATALAYIFRESLFRTSLDDFLILLSFSRRVLPSVERQRTETEHGEARSVGMLLVWYLCDGPVDVLESLQGHQWGQGQGVLVLQYTICIVVPILRTRRDLTPPLARSQRRPAPLHLPQTPSLSRQHVPSSSRNTAR